MNKNFTTQNKKHNLSLRLSYTTLSLGLLVILLSLYPAKGFAQTSEVEGPDLICQDDTAHFVLKNLEGGWEILNTKQEVIQEGTEPSIQFPAMIPGDYTLIGESANNKKTVLRQFAVLPKPQPPTMIFGPDTACLGTAFRYYAKEDPAQQSFTQLKWETDSGWVMPKIGDSSEIAFFHANAMVKVTRFRIDLPSCVSEPFEKKVMAGIPKPKIINPVPTAPYVCADSKWEFRADYDQADWYDWRVVPEQAIGIACVIEGNGTNHATIQFHNIKRGSDIFGIELIMKKCGSTRRDTVWYRLNATPNFKVEASSNTVCEGEEVTLNIVPDLKAGETANWHFGDQTIDTGGQITHIFPKNSNKSVYRPTVVIKDQCGLFATVQTPPLTIYPKPLAAISYDPNIKLNTVANPSSKMLWATLFPGHLGNINYKWEGPDGAGPDCSTCID